MFGWRSDQGNQARFAASSRLNNSDTEITAAAKSTTTARRARANDRAKGWPPQAERNPGKVFNDRK